MRFSKYIIFCFLGLVIFSCGENGESNGDDLFDDGDYAAAINAYNDVLANDPRDVKSLYNRGRSYEELGQLEKAMADYEAVVEIDPKNVNAFLSLAKLSYNEGNFNKALVYTGNVIDVNENSAQAQFLSARSSHQLGYYDQAMEAYNNAITLNRDFGEAYLYRGALKIGQKRISSACEDFKFAQSLGIDGAEGAIKQYCQ